MSVWHSFSTHQPLAAPGLGEDLAYIADSYLDVASANSWYAGRALRFTLADGDGVDISQLLDRMQVEQLVADLAKWLERTA